MLNLRRKSVPFPRVHMVRSIVMAMHCLPSLPSEDDTRVVEMMKNREGEDLSYSFWTASQIIHDGLKAGMWPTE